MFAPSLATLNGAGAEESFDDVYATIEEIFEKESSAFPSEEYSASNSSASTSEEYSAPSIEYGKNGRYGVGLVEQVDVAPTLALLLGLAIPANSIGRVIPRVIASTAQLQQRDPGQYVD